MTVAFKKILKNDRLEIKHLPIVLFNTQDSIYIIFF